jgi:hypothetical protein
MIFYNKYAYNHKTLLVELKFILYNIDKLHIKRWKQEMLKTPVYQIIENDIKEKIKKGELNRGDMIHSENELKEIYSVSRMTVRQALNNLVKATYIVIKGRELLLTILKLKRRCRD